MFTGLTLDERLASVPFSNIFTQADKSMASQLPDRSDLASKQTINSLLKSLNARELHSYLCKIAWPKSLYVEPVKKSDSYTRPHMIPNPSILDSHAQALAKKDATIKNAFMEMFIEIKATEGEPKKPSKRKKSRSK